MGVDFSAEYSGSCCCYHGRDSEKVSLSKYVCVVVCNATPPGCGLHGRNHRFVERHKFLPASCDALPTPTSEIRNLP